MKKFTISMAIMIAMAFSFQAFAQTVEFEDDFESGSANWELTGTWGLTDAQSNSPSNSLTDSPGGNYSASQDTDATLVNGIDLSAPGILSASVSFAAIYDIETSTDFDWVTVLASDDDFANSAEIAIFNGEGNLTPWVDYSYSLGAFIGSDDVKIRFHFHSDGGYEVDGIYIDDFMVTSSDVDDSAPYIGYLDPPAFYEATLEDFVLAAELIDVSGIAMAVVNYQVDGGAWESVDGVNITGDVYQFTIPAQAAGELVNFNLEATDASSASNNISTADYQYISGDHLYYDDPEVEFYTSLMANGGAAVVFDINAPTTLVTALVRNYEDQSNPPNKNFMFHFWEAGGAGPGDDMITPFEVVPAATVENPNPMTVIDLRSFVGELDLEAGNSYFMGITVPEDTVKITMAPLNANRSMALDPATGTWGAATGDFHFRLVTDGTDVGTDNSVSSEIEAAIMFPNPTTDVLYINSKSEIINLTVVNTAGQVVMNNAVHSEKTQIEVNKLQAGVYFVNVETAKGISTQKIVVK